ncbi:MAG: hypothetical protein JXJ19_09875, partial [Elusimicrobia bacterium]|nr:hypothetical protein [Elusimicrobiota bacterium]
MNNEDKKILTPTMKGQIRRAVALFTAFAMFSTNVCGLLTKAAADEAETLEQQKRLRMATGYEGEYHWDREVTVAADAAGAGGASGTAGGGAVAEEMTLVSESDQVVAQQQQATIETAQDMTVADWFNAFMNADPETQAQMIRDLGLDISNIPGADLANVTFEVLSPLLELLAQSSDVINCAVQSLSNLLVSLGVFSSLDEIDQTQMAISLILVDILNGTFSMTEDGQINTSMFAVAAVAEQQYGVDLNGMQVDDLGGLGDGSYILQVDVNNDGVGDHYVVATITGDSVTYNDNGVTGTMSLDEFNDKYNFTGNALTDDTSKGNSIHDTGGAWMKDQVGALAGAAGGYGGSINDSLGSLFDGGYFDGMDISLPELMAMSMADLNSVLAEIGLSVENLIIIDYLMDSGIEEFSGDGALNAAVNASKNFTGDMDQAQAFAQIYIDSVTEGAAADVAGAYANQAAIHGADFSVEDLQIFETVYDPDELFDAGASWSAVESYVEADYSSIEDYTTKLIDAFNDVMDATDGNRDAALGFIKAGGDWYNVEDWIAVYEYVAAYQDDTDMVEDAANYFISHGGSENADREVFAHGVAMMGTVQGADSIADAWATAVYADAVVPDDPFAADTAVEEAEPVVTETVVPEEPVLVAEDTEVVEETEVAEVEPEVEVSTEYLEAYEAVLAGTEGNGMDEQDRINAALYFASQAEASGISDYDAIAMASLYASTLNAAQEAGLDLSSQSAFAFVTGGGTADNLGLYIEVMQGSTDRVTVTAADALYFVTHGGTSANKDLFTAAMGMSTDTVTVTAADAMTFVNGGGTSSNIFAFGGVMQAGGTAQQAVYYAVSGGQAGNIDAYMQGLTQFGGSAQAAFVYSGLEAGDQRDAFTSAYTATEGNTAASQAYALLAPDARPSDIAAFAAAYSDTGDAAAAAGQVATYEDLNETQQAAYDTITDGGLDDEAALAFVQQFPDATVEQAELWLEVYNEVAYGGQYQINGDYADMEEYAIAAANMFTANGGTDDEFYDYTHSLSYEVGHDKTPEEAMARVIGTRYGIDNTEFTDFDDMFRRGMDAGLGFEASIAQGIGHVENGYEFDSEELSLFVESFVELSATESFGDALTHAAECVETGFTPSQTVSVTSIEQGLTDLGYEGDIDAAARYYADNGLSDSMDINTYIQNVMNYGTPENAVAVFNFVDAGGDITDIDLYFSLGGTDAQAFVDALAEGSAMSIEDLYGICGRGTDDLTAEGAQGELALRYALMQTIGAEAAEAGNRLVITESGYAVVSHAEETWDNTLSQQWFARHYGGDPAGAQAHWEAEHYLEVWNETHPGEQPVIADGVLADFTANGVTVAGVPLPEGTALVQNEAGNSVLINGDPEIYNDLIERDMGHEEALELAEAAAASGDPEAFIATYFAIMDGDDWDFYLDEFEDNWGLSAHDIALHFASTGLSADNVDTVLTYMETVYEALDRFRDEYSGDASYSEIANSALSAISYYLGLGGSIETAASYVEGYCSLHFVFGFDHEDAQGLAAAYAFLDRGMSLGVNWQQFERINNYIQGHPDMLANMSYNDIIASCYVDFVRGDAEDYAEAWAWTMGFINADNIETFMSNYREVAGDMGTQEALLVAVSGTVDMNDAVVQATLAYVETEDITAAQATAVSQGLTDAIDMLTTPVAEGGYGLDEATAQDLIDNGKVDLYVEAVTMVDTDGARMLTNQQALDYVINNGSQENLQAYAEALHSGYMNSEQALELFCRDTSGQLAVYNEAMRHVTEGGFTQQMALDYALNGGIGGENLRNFVTVVSGMEYGGEEYNEALNLFTLKDLTQAQIDVYNYMVDPEHNLIGKGADQLTIDQAMMYIRSGGTRENIDEYVQALHDARIELPADEVLAFFTQGEFNITTEQWNVYVTARGRVGEGPGSINVEQARDFALSVGDPGLLDVFVAACNNATLQAEAADAELSVSSYAISLIQGDGILAQNLAMYDDMIGGEYPNIGAEEAMAFIIANGNTGLITGEQIQAFNDLLASDAVAARVGDGETVLSVALDIMFGDGVSPEDIGLIDAIADGEYGEYANIDYEAIAAFINSNSELWTNDDGTINEEALRTYLDAYNAALGSDAIQQQAASIAGGNPDQNLYDTALNFIFGDNISGRDGEWIDTLTKSPEEGGYGLSFEDALAFLQDPGCNPGEVWTAADFAQYASAYADLVNDGGYFEGDNAAALSFLFGDGISLQDVEFLD